MKYIFILNNTVPVEPFLKTELEIASQFDDFKIFICPFKSYEKQNEKSKFEIIDTCVRGNDKHLFFRALIKFVFSNDFWNELLHIFNKRGFFKNSITLLRFGVSAQVKHYKIVNAINKRNLVVGQDDKIIFYAYWMHQEAYTAILLKKLFTNSKSITRCHGYDLYEDRALNRYLPLRKCILNEIDRVYPISDNGREYLLKNYPKWASSQRIFVRRLGTFDFGLNQITSGQCLTVVSCSHLIPLKRIELIILALSKITDISIRWLHYGDGPLRNELEISARKNLNSNIQWNFMGEVSNKRLMQEYANNSMDLFVNVSSTEGIPVSIMEAMSFGTPVIATDVGGTSEIVSDGENGWLLPENFDVDLLTKKIKSFFYLPNKQKLEFRESARRTWNSKYSAQTNFTLFYKEICG